MSEKLLPCPFCGSEIKHVESVARSFNPPRLYHEWHHAPMVDCPLSHGCTGSFIIANATDDEAAQKRAIERWNMRPEGSSAPAPEARMPVAFRFKKANGRFSYVENIDAEEDRFKPFWQPLFLTASATGGKPIAYRIGHQGGGYHYADANSPPREPEKWIALYPESSLFDEPACRGSSEASQHHSGDLEPGSSEAIARAYDAAFDAKQEQGAGRFEAHQAGLDAIAALFRSAASTVEPAAVSPLDDTRNPNVLRERRGWGAAPTTSPEPDAVREALKPFADLADAMYVSGHCGGASPEDWPDKWSISTTGGKDHHMPQAQGGVLTVADFRKLACLYHSLARNDRGSGVTRS